MGEADTYTPDVSDLAFCYIGLSIDTPAQASAQFERCIAAVARRAEVEALRDRADALEEGYS